MYVHGAELEKTHEPMYILSSLVLGVFHGFDEGGLFLL